MEENANKIIIKTSKNFKLRTKECKNPKYIKKSTGLNKSLKKWSYF